jgi:hypothetical protein
LLDERQDQRRPALGQDEAAPLRAFRRLARILKEGTRIVCMRKGFVHIVISLQRGADLFQIVQALDPVDRFAHFLDGGKKERDQHGEDGKEDEQLHQRKARLAVCPAGLKPPMQVGTGDRARVLPYSSGPRWNGNVISPGTQTSCPDDAGPVRIWLGG